MRNYFFILMGILLFYAQQVAAQSVQQRLPVLEIRIDGSALGTAIDDMTSLVTLNGVELQALETDAGTVYRSQVHPGDQIVKVLVPGQGADLSKITVEDGAVGTFAITLVPHLTGLDQYIDDYRLEWASEVQRNIVPTDGPIRLHFVDAEGVRIPVNELSDARLSLRYSKAISLPIADMLTVDERGIITLTNVTRLHQTVVNFKADQSGHQRADLVLAIRARDEASGLVFDAETEPFRLGNVPVTGQILRGENVPERISLSGIRVRVGVIRVETDEAGKFKVPGIPAGEALISATVYDRRTTETGRRYTVTYRASETFDLSGPAKIQIKLGRRHRESDGGTVNLVAHDPMPQPLPQDERLSSRPDLSIPVAARYRMINLTTYEDLTAIGPELSNAEQICNKAYLEGWRARPYCPVLVLGPRITRRAVWSSPEPHADLIGEIHVDGKVWYVEQSSKRAALVPPEYYLGDWGYQAFGYAVTVLGLTPSRVAIRLPQTDSIGWLDVAGLAEGSFRLDADWGRRNRFLGFYPLESCGEKLGREEIVVEALDEDNLTYRLPTPHDLWSVYSDAEQPPLEEHESFTVNWRETYSADGRILLVPNPGKEC